MVCHVSCMVGGEPPEFLSVGLDVASRSQGEFYTLFFRRLEESIIPRHEEVGNSTSYTHYKEIKIGLKHDGKA
jgi:hypothetical protein